MTNIVKVVLAVEFETRDERTANATLARIPGDLRISIQEGRLGHAMTGVIPGSVSVEVREATVM